MNVVIIDDEPLARARIKRLLQHNEHILVKGEGDNGAQGLAIIKQVHPDLVFLDIDMPGINGLEVAQQLNTLSVPPAIVFVTAYPEHALDALQLSAAGYLVKPVTEQALNKVLAQVGRLNKAHMQKQQSTKISYQLGGTIKSIELDQVYYFNAQEKYTNMVFKEGEALIEQSLKQLEQRFPTQLLRIHRNTLINKQKLVALHTQSPGVHSVELAGCKEQLSVSRRELKTVKNALC
ncbi:MULTISPECIES: LytTR family DNA-binding domain-containing protein [Pseudoalteromonas]|jgi:two-component system response regulator AlgR|uniref:LytR/AlgR family response regulator transcription factor n=1 Tax=Pseudoalteromonas TaxID=53246 RepID=UPI0002CCA8CB|nr:MULTISPECIES: LytTR family DNA-binding domain-containing protein [Pseudoalteromonas]ENN98240.1 alginate biosynthesis regulatory protein [Pseudoalteromonas agarivorans S816]MCQ8884756.1 LytTR family DNA-binding domain-containing protein [Pseudoalteromonas agarivorans]TMP14975.1 DNA-binding response regulator [Pseudoalteromonas sp. S2893]TMS67147.1 DNA-binding response regulator [Pseudoalteromonas sp. S1691]TMS71616.1 DNA-binding response regulator [Pseudoalteromonas sp. S1731]